MCEFTEMRAVLTSLKLSIGPSVCLFHRIVLVVVSGWNGALPRFHSGWRRSGLISGVAFLNAERIVGTMMCTNSCPTSCCHLS